MSRRTDRLGNIFVEEISKIIRDEVKDEEIGFITINSARVSSDLSYAKVYFTSLDNDKEMATKALNRASSFIRGKLCEKIDLRKMPELTFVYDDSISYGQNIETIIDKIKGEE